MNNKSTKTFHSIDDSQTEISVSVGWEISQFATYDYLGQFVIAKNEVEAVNKAVESNPFYHSMSTRKCVALWTKTLIGDDEEAHRRLENEYNVRRPYYLWYVPFNYTTDDHKKHREYVKADAIILRNIILGLAWFEYAKVVISAKLQTTRHTLELSRGASYDVFDDASRQARNDAVHETLEEVICIAEKVLSELESPVLLPSKMILTAFSEVNNESQ